MGCYGIDPFSSYIWVRVKMNVTGLIPLCCYRGLKCKKEAYWQRTAGFRVSPTWDEPCCCPKVT